MSRLVVLQHLAREGPGLFVKIAEEREMNVSIYRLDQRDRLPELMQGDLLLVLGGPMGIRDINNANYLWLYEEFDFIKDAFNKHICIIGVCLGAQLLAHAVGGDVEVLLRRSSSEALAEVGWETITFQDQETNELFSKSGKDPFYALHWHGDRILLPPLAELLASSRRCKEQFFQIGRHAYGLQFHVEIDDEMVGIWINEDIEFIRSALGMNAESILQKQQKLYGNKTFRSRLFFLRRLFDEMGY